MLKNYLLDFWYQDFTLMTGLVWLVLLSIVWFLPKNKAWMCALPALLVIFGVYALVAYSQAGVKADERKLFTQKCALEGEFIYETVPEVLGILLDDEAYVFDNDDFSGWFAQDRHTGEFENAVTQPYDDPIAVISAGGISRLKNSHGYYYLDYLSRHSHETEHYRNGWKAIEKWQLDRLPNLPAVNEVSLYRVWTQKLQDEDLQNTGIKHYSISIVNRQSQELVAEKHLYTFEEQFKPKEGANFDREKPISCQLKSADQLSNQILLFVFRVLPPKQVISDDAFMQRTEEIEALAKQEKLGG